MTDKLSEIQYFGSSLFVVKKPEFLESVKEASRKYLEQGVSSEFTKMSPTYAHDELISDFSGYVSQTAWNILAAQGYAMDNIVTFFTEMWTQEHQRHSHMETHIHGGGAQISAFYFTDVPEGGCKMVIHDPRPAKVIISLPEADEKKLTPASRQVVLSPESGTLVFMSAWLPHSFTQNRSDEPTRFVHMNLGISVATQPNVEVL